jgi:SAM-dependent methyltransferase
MSYWSSRPIADSARSLVYHWLNWLTPLLSIRLAQDRYIKEALEDVCDSAGRRAITVLDLGCGAGQIHARDPRFRFYGADIAGFPATQCKNKGYEAAVCYDGQLGLPESTDWCNFDVALILHVNAHVPSEYFSRMVDTARLRLRAGGTLLIVAELDNKGLCYRWMNALGRSRFRRYVDWMGHKYFDDQHTFEGRLVQLGANAINREYLVGQFVPFIHLWAYVFGSVPYRLLRWPSLIADAALSVLDRVSLKVSLDSYGRSFIVAYKVVL